MKTKLKTLTALFLALTLCLALFAGCAKTPSENPTAPADDTALSSFYFKAGDVEIRMGMPFAELATQLGEEAKPAETVNACDPASDWKQISHFYPGITINEDKDGLVFGAEMTQREVPGGEVTFGDTVMVNSAPEDVRALLGEPESEDMGSLFYTIDGYTVAFYFDEENYLTGAAVMEAP